MQRSLIKGKKRRKPEEEISGEIMADSKAQGHNNAERTLSQDGDFRTVRVL